MKSGFLGLRTVVYKVKDIHQAREWYSKVLGIKPYFDEPFYVGFNVAGYELGLQPDGGNNQPESGGTVTYWGVEDVWEKYGELLGYGATAHEEPTDVGDNIVVATVKDPWGNLIGIIYNPHFVL